MKLFADKKDPSEYTDEYYRDAIFELTENFCDERIEDVKTIGRTLYGNKRKTAQNKNAEFQMAYYTIRETWIANLGKNFYETTLNALAASSNASIDIADMFFTSEIAEINRKKGNEADLLKADEELSKISGTIDFDNLKITKRHLELVYDETLKTLIPTGIELIKDRKVKDLEEAKKIILKTNDSFEKMLKSLQDNINVSTKSLESDIKLIDTAIRAEPDEQTIYAKIYKLRLSICNKVASASSVLAGKYIQAIQKIMKFNIDHLKGNTKGEA